MDRFKIEITYDAYVVVDCNKEFPKGSGNYESVFAFDSKSEAMDACDRLNKKVRTATYVEPSFYEGVPF